MATSASRKSGGELGDLGVEAIESMRVSSFDGGGVGELLEVIADGVAATRREAARRALKNVLRRARSR